LLIVLI